MTRENVLLMQICEELVDLEHIKRTETLMLDWMNDMKQVDGVAEWSWRILEPLFAGER